MPHIQNLRWRLTYADGTSIDEAPDRSSLRLAPKGAVVLLLCEVLVDQWQGGIRRELVAIDLSGKDRGRTMPFLYRHREMEINGRPGIRDVRLILGRAHPSKGEATVWMWADDGLVDCPPQHIEAVTIETFLE